MSLADLHSANKARRRLRPTRIEGHYIKFQLIRRGWRPEDVREKLNLSSGMVPLVIFGGRRSAKIEAEIARILGKQSWNDVVQEARAATSGATASRLRQERRVAG